MEQLLRELAPQVLGALARRYGLTASEHRRPQNTGMMAE